MLFVSLFFCLVAVSAGKDYGCKGDPNAVSTECGSTCRPSCVNPNPKICTLQCIINGCVCNPGYLLGPNGKCVKPENCPKSKSCGGDDNAVLSICGNQCSVSCEHPTPRPCTKICGKPDCTCKKGYRYCEATGKCVPTKSCEADCLCKSK